MTGWMVEKISRSGWRMKWRRLRPVTTTASVTAAAHRPRSDGTPQLRSRGTSRRAPAASTAARVGPVAVLAGRRAPVELQEDVVEASASAARCR